MRDTSSLMLEQYAKMSGDKKIRLGLSLSQAVRRVRQDGINALKNNGKRSRTTP